MNSGELEVMKKQREFISNNAKDAPVQRVRNSKRAKQRNKSVQYYFSIRGEQIRVCKQFYVDTLDISHAVIDTALNAGKPFTRITDNDQRGKHENRPNRVPAAVIY